MVEFSPATREARVRFPASARCMVFYSFFLFFFFEWVNLKMRHMVWYGMLLNGICILSLPNTGAPMIPKNVIV